MSESAPNGTTEAPGAASTPAVKVEEPKSYSPAEVEKILAASRQNAAEAKQYREKLDAEAARVANAEKAKLESEGKWKELAESERKRADEIAGKATKADEYAKELDALKSLELASLPEDMRALVADLPPTKAIALARKLQAQNAGPHAAPAINGGAPGGPKIPVDLSGLAQTPGAYAALPKNEQDAVANSLGLWRRGSRKA